MKRLLIFTVLLFQFILMKSQHSIDFSLDSKVTGNLRKTNITTENMKYGEINGGDFISLSAGFTKETEHSKNVTFHSSFYLGYDWLSFSFYKNNTLYDGGFGVHYLSYSGYFRTDFYKYFFFSPFTRISKKVDFQPGREYAFNHGLEKFGLIDSVSKKDKIEDFGIFTGFETGLQFFHNTFQLGYEFSYGLIPFIKLDVIPHYSIVLHSIRLTYHLKLDQ
jgi:hypothetical protein